MAEYKGLLLSFPVYSLGYFMLGLYVTAGIFAFHIAAVPLIFKYSKKFRRNLIFANAFRWPLNTDFDDIEKTGLVGARNLYIKFHSKVDDCDMKIGIWHILPKSRREKLEGTCGHLNADQYNDLMKDELTNAKTPVVLYCHGNSDTRAASHRTMLYKFFQQMDFTTIAFDYRGYGDSTRVNPSEAGVVEDTLMVYEWLHSMLKQSEHNPPLFVWGHSLGTGIASHLLGNLNRLSAEAGRPNEPLPLPRGLILEAPFNNLAEEVANHPLTPLVTWLPYFEEYFVEPFKRCPEHEFKSDGHLVRVKDLPILILHAKDDNVVPHTCGLKLYNTILESRKDGGAPVTFRCFERSERLGHKYICMAQDLPSIVGEFVAANR